MTDAETTQAIEALAHRIRQRDSEPEHEADAEVFALEFMTALRGRGWRPTSAKTTAPPLHAPPLPDKPSRDEALAAVRADMEARRLATLRGDGERGVNPALAARVRQLQAEADHRRAIREFQARRQWDEQQRIRALLSEVVAVLAEALEVEDRCDKCPACLRALSPRRVTCPRCGWDARSAEWPVTREEAAA